MRNISYDRLLWLTPCRVTCASKSAWQDGIISWEKGKFMCSIFLHSNDSFLSCYMPLCRSDHSVDISKSFRIISRSKLLEYPLKVKSSFGDISWIQNCATLELVGGKWINALKKDWAHKLSSLQGYDTVLSGKRSTEDCSTESKPMQSRMHKTFHEMNYSMRLKWKRLTRNRSSSLNAASPRGKNFHFILTLLPFSQASRKFSVVNITCYDLKPRDLSFSQSFSMVLPSLRPTMALNIWMIRLLPCEPQTCDLKFSESEGDFVNQRSGRASETVFPYRIDLEPFRLLVYYGWRFPQGRSDVNFGCFEKVSHVSTPVTDSGSFLQPFFFLNIIIFEIFSLFDWFPSWSIRASLIPTTFLNH
jgi:hypothetical protein